MKTYQEIKQEHQDKYNQIMTNNLVFWAFSTEQFKEGLAKINLPAGEKITRLPAGGFVPSKNVDKLINELADADKQQKAELKYGHTAHNGGGRNLYTK